MANATQTPTIDPRSVLDPSQPLPTLVPGAKPFDLTPPAPKPELEPEPYRDPFRPGALIGVALAVLLAVGVVVVGAMHITRTRGYEADQPPVVATPYAASQTPGR